MNAADRSRILIDKANKELGHIIRELDRYQGLVDADAADWATVGDLGWLAERLTDAADFLTSSR